MAYEIYNYVADKVADYPTILDVTPHKTLTEMVEKNQTVHEYDSGLVDIVTASDVAFFTATLQWDAIPEAEAGLIFDLFADASKANGQARTFYITLPDQKTYTVRFTGPLKRVVTSNLMAVGRRSIDQLILRIEGRKAA